MKIKKYQNGGKDPVLEKMAREQLAADRAVMMDEAMRQNIIPDPRVTGAISVDRPYIFDFMGAGELASLAARGVRALAGRGARSVADDAVSPLIRLQSKQADDRLQNLADRAIREGSREESQTILDLQRSMQNVLDDAISESKSIDELQVAAQKVLDDMELQGMIDERQYSRFLKDIDEVFNEARGGSVSGDAIFENQRLNDALRRGMPPFGENNPSLQKRIQEGLQGKFDELLKGVDLTLHNPRLRGVKHPNPRMNKYGGKIKVLKK